MIWACFLHFYQPPTQKKYWIDRITDEAYRRIVKGLLDNPDAKITLNVNSVLLELWDEHGHHDVISGLKELVRRGQVELTGSAKFHPLLPKLPEEEIIRQIILNEISLYQYLGVVGPVLRSNSGGENQNSKPVSGFEFRASDLALRGFFPPEMAYDRRLAQIVANLGYEWIIAEELSLGKAVRYDRIYEVSELKAQSVIASDLPAQAGAWQSNTEIASAHLPRNDKGGHGLKIFFRDRGFSYKMLAGYLGTRKLFLDDLERKFPGGQQKTHFLLTAMDGETFGHHRPGMEKLLFDVFKTPQVQMTHLSDLPRIFPARESVETKPATWALMEHEVEKNLPFARWDDPGNDVHRLQWQLTNLSIRSVENSKFKPQTSNQTQNSKRILNNLNFNVDLSLEFCDLNLDLVNRLSIKEREWVKARRLLDQALHSDQYWWASAKPWWSIEYIEKGAKELLGCVVSLSNHESQKREARSLYYQILETAFDYQRSGKVDEISRKEDETLRMRSDQALPKMPKEELLKIIKTIRDEMLAVASNQEYERAAQLRDRIKELEQYLNSNE